MSKNGSNTTNVKTGSTTQHASPGRGTSAVPQTPVQANAAVRSSAAQATSSQASRPVKTYVGVIVYIDVDGTIKPERIALGNRLFGISSIVSVNDVRNDHDSDNLIRDYTVEIWNGPSITKTSHLFLERTHNGIRWYVMQKAKAGTSV